MAILGLTVMSPELAAPERRADLVHLLVGLPFFFLVAALIAYGDRFFGALARLFRAAPERAGRIGRFLQEKLVMLLSLSALGRMLVFAANGAGVRPRLSVSPLTLRFTRAEPEPGMWWNAFLMAVILAFLVRAAWLPLLWRRAKS